MDLYLTAGFGDPIGAADLALIKSLGFVGVKQDVYPGRLAAVVAEVVATPWLKVLFLLKPASLSMMPELVEAIRLHKLQSRTAIEMIGEPETFDQMIPETLAAWMRYAGSTYPDITWVVGGMAGVTPAGLSYLARVMQAGIPQDTIISFHGYRTLVSPDDSLFPYISRQDEFDCLHTLAAGRRLWCTEIGWHTAPSRKRRFLWWWKTVQFTEDQIAAFTAREIEIQRAAGVEVFTWFQFNDGPDPLDHEHHYGLRSVTHQLKPVAQVFGADRR